jgi:hypothetical protein
MIFVLVILAYLFVALLVNIVIRCANLIGDDAYCYGYENDVLFASLFWPLSIPYFIGSKIAFGLNTLSAAITSKICSNKK